MCDRQLSFEVHGLDEADKTQLATSDELTLIREVVDPKSRRQGSIGVGKLRTPKGSWSASSIRWHEPGWAGSRCAAGIRDR